METSIWFPIYSCQEKPPPWQRGLAGHGPQGRKESDTTQVTLHAEAQDFCACGSSAPVRVKHEGGAAAGVAGTLEARVCRDTDSLCHRSHGPVRVFSPASCSWWSEGLRGQSFPVALPVQALRGLPCPGSFSVARRIRHTEGPLAWGPLL